MYLVVVASGLAAVLDIKYGRLPNWLTVGLLSSAILLSLRTAGFASLGRLLATPGLVLVFLWPLYRLGALGGGDIKMLAALSTFWPWPTWVGLLLNVAAAGLALALVTEVATGDVRLCLARVRGMVLTFRITGELSVFPLDNGALPYGVAIGLGALVTLVWNPVAMAAKP